MLADNQSKRNIIRKLLWKRRNNFKGLGKIVRILHQVKLKPNLKLVYDAVKRR